MNRIEVKQLTLPWILFSVISGLLFSAPVLNSFLFDDAYIHARIADNFLLYGTPVFNRGDVFKVDSSTGFVLLISLLSKIFGTIGAIRVIEFFSIFFTIIGIFWLVKQSNCSLFKGFFVAICTIPFMLLAAYGGMETTIVCMLITGAAIAYQYKKYSITIMLLAFCPWFRFETILLLIITLIYLRRKLLIIYAFPFLVLLGTDFYFFGDIIPHAARAKSVGYGFPIDKSVINALSFQKGWIGAIVGITFVCFLFLRVIKFIKIFRIDFSDILLLFSTGVFLSWIVGRSLIFPWYYSLLTFPFGVAVLIEKEYSKLDDGVVGFLHKIVEIFVIAGFGFLGINSTLEKFGPKATNSSNIRVERYLEIGSALYSFCPNCKLLTSEIGGLGYSYKGIVYDAFGLGDPEAVKYHPMKVPDERQGYGVGAIPPKYVIYRSPDFVVSMPVFSLALRSSGVVDSYVMYRCPLGKDNKNLTIFGDKEIQVFSRSILPKETVSSMGCERISCPVSYDCIEP